jgi:hypothetical protein
MIRGQGSAARVSLAGAPMRVVGPAPTACHEPNVTDPATGHRAVLPSPAPSQQLYMGLVILPVGSEAGELDVMALPVPPVDSPGRPDYNVAEISVTRDQR